MVGMKLGDRLGASGYVKKGKKHPRAVIRNRDGFNRAEDTRDGGRQRARKRRVTASTERGRRYRERMSRVERVAGSAKRTSATAIRPRVGVRCDPVYTTRCYNWTRLVATALSPQGANRRPHVAATLRQRKEPVVGRGVVAIPLPTAGRQARQLTIGTLVGWDKGRTKSWAYVETRDDEKKCFPIEQVFGL